MGNERIYSKPGPNGSTLYFDQKGKYVGKSVKSFNGNINHFDAKGKYAGKSTSSFSGATKHFDTKGKYIGSSVDSALGGKLHFNADGSLKGRSAEGFGDRYALEFLNPEIVAESNGDITSKGKNGGTIDDQKSVVSAILGVLFIIIFFFILLSC